MYESKDKMVSHPGHYKCDGAPEVIDIIESSIGDLTGVIASDTANIIKYAFRWNKKNGIQDVEKILWYSTHLKEKVCGLEERTEEYFIRYGHDIDHEDIMMWVASYTSDMDDPDIKYTAKMLMYDAISWSVLEDIDAIINDANELLDKLKENTNG